MTIEPIAHVTVRGGFVGVNVDTVDLFAQEAAILVAFIADGWLWSGRLSRVGSGPLDTFMSDWLTREPQRSTVAPVNADAIRTDAPLVVTVPPHAGLVFLANSRPDVLLEAVLSCDSSATIADLTDSSFVTEHLLTRHSGWLSATLVPSDVTDAVIILTNAARQVVAAATTETPATGLISYVLRGGCRTLDRAADYADASVSPLEAAQWEKGDFGALPSADALRQIAVLSP